MTNKFQSMPSSELNKACAEALGWELHEELDGANHYWGLNKDYPVIDRYSFDPCTNANQIQEYLWPKLGDSLQIKIHRKLVNGKVVGSVIIKAWSEITFSWKILTAISYKDGDINKTQVIAFLEVMALKGGSV